MLNKLDLRKDVRALGRVSIDDSGILVGWNASGVEFCFNGTGFIANIRGVRTSEQHYDRFTCEIDGVEKAQRLQISLGVNTLKIDGLENRPHTVKLFKSCMLIITHSVIESIAVEGQILPPPAPKKHKILAIGDSISIGRVVYARGEQDMSTHEVNSCTKAYPYRTAKAFDADLHLIAASGYGIVSCADGTRDNIIPANFDFDVPSTKSPCKHEYKPDLIIFNLGTNDTAAKVPKEEFKPAAEAFFERIRTAYGNVPIVIFYGAMGTPWEDIYREIIAKRAENGDTNMYLHILEHTRPEHTICAHPTDDMGEIYAQDTVKFIKDTFAW